MNSYIAVSYQLYEKLKDDSEERLQEQRTEQEPFIFITGIGSVPPPFEQHVEGLKQGDEIDFHIQPHEVFGEYDPSLVVNVPKASFLDEGGQLDGRLFFEGNVIPMEDANGGRYIATIVKIGEEDVTVDLNHPKAGASLHFKGRILVHRPATEQEVQQFVEASQRRCGGCGGCGGGSCESDGCEGGCGGCS